MKVELTVKEPTPMFPCVMQHRDNKDLIVLFTEAGGGVCLSPKSNPTYGEFTRGWTANNWKPCCVTLDSTGE